MSDVKEPKAKVSKPGHEKKHPNHMGMFGPAGLYGMDMLQGGGMFGPAGLYGIDLVKDKKKTDGAQNTAARFNPYVQATSGAEGKVEMNAAQPATEQKKTAAVQTPAPVTEPVKKDAGVSTEPKPETTNPVTGNSTQITASSTAPAADSKITPVQETPVKPAEKTVVPAVENKVAVSPAAGKTVTSPPVTTALVTTSAAPVTSATAGVTTTALGTGNAEVKTPEVKTGTTGTAETDLTVATGEGSAGAGAGAGADNKDGGKDTVVKAPVTPDGDPAFQAVLQQVKQQKDAQVVHPDAKGKANEAKKASHIDPGLEKKGLAGQTQVGNMSTQPTKKFDSAGFASLLEGKIHDAIPSTEDKAKEFKDQNKLGEVKDGMGKEVANQKTATGAQGISKAANDPLNTDAVTVTPPVPMKDENAGKEPVVEGADQAAPKPKTDGEISMQKDAVANDNNMAKNGVTDAQLAESNEPEFTGALDTKNKAKQEALNAPAEYRLAEGPMLQKASTDAKGDVHQTMGAFHGVRSNAFKGVAGGKDKAKTGDEEVRRKVAEQMGSMYEGTKARVNGILNKMDLDVNHDFDSTISAANQTFQGNVGEKLDHYYSWVQRGKRLLTSFVGGLPEDVNNIFRDEKQRFLNTVNPMIKRVADRVAQGLNDAMNEIANGKKALDDFWSKQSPETKKIADAAFKEINGKYGELETQVANKQTELADKLAKKYVAAVGQLQGEFDKIKEDKKGWLDRAADAITGVINAIRDLKNMLVNTLSRVAHVVGDIVAHPINFLGNMISAVGTGFKNFASNILTHLKKGFFEWLLGVLPAGLTMPEKWDLPGIFHFVMQFFDLTWLAIKAKVAKLVGQPVADVLETAFDIFQTIKKDGIIGLWNYVKEKVGDLKTMVIDALMGMLQNQVVQAGITWLLGLLTPAGAFIKACQAIYGIVMWFVNNAKRIMELINSIIDSAALIVAGKLDSAAAMVENAMARIIPIAIGFLAGLLNLGNIGKLVQDIINKVRAPIEKAIDWVVDKAVAFANRTGITQMIQKGVGFVKGKVAAVKGKLSGKKEEPEHKEEHSPEKEKKINEGLSDVGVEEKKYEKNGEINHEDAVKVAGTIKTKHSVFSSFSVVDGGDTWDYDYTASPGRRLKGDKKQGGASNQVPRPKELQGKDTPKLDKLVTLEISQGLTGDKLASYRYVNDFLQVYKGTQYKVPADLVAYVENRAARKLGKKGEGASIAKYENASGTTGVAKRYIDVYDDGSYTGAPRLRIPDIYKDGVVVGDVKDVNEISLDEQMRDNVKICQGFAKYPNDGPINKPKKFDLVVREGLAEDGIHDATHVSAPLSKAIDDNNGKIYRLI